MTLGFVKVESWRESDIYSEMREARTTVDTNRRIVQEMLPVHGDCGQGGHIYVLGVAIARTLKDDRFRIQKGSTMLSIGRCDGSEFGQAL